MAQRNGRQRIEDLAHSIWEAEGRPEGRAAEHWAEAEYQLYGSAGYDESREARDDGIIDGSFENYGARDVSPQTLSRSDGAVSGRRSTRRAAR